MPSRVQQISGTLSHEYYSCGEQPSISSLDGRHVQSAMLENRVMNCDTTADLSELSMLTMPGLMPRGTLGMPFAGASMACTAAWSEQPVTQHDALKQFLLIPLATFGYFQDIHSLMDLCKAYTSACPKHLSC